MPRKSEPTPHDLAVGSRIRELRHERGLSLTSLAALAAISKGHLSSIEAGLQSITVKTLVALAAGLNVAPMYLLVRPEADERQHAAELLRRLPAVEAKAFRRQLQARVRGAK